MLMAECYYRDMPDGHRRWYYPDEVEVQSTTKPVPLERSPRKTASPWCSAASKRCPSRSAMSFEPRDIINKFGADTARSFVMFAGPPDQSAAWSNSGAEGTFRFLRRIWNWAYAHQTHLNNAQEASTSEGFSHEARHLRREIHSCLKQADYDYSRMQYNTVVSACMKMFNAIDGFKGTESEGGKAALKEAASILLRTLYPMLRTSPPHSGKSSASSQSRATSLMRSGPRFPKMPSSR